MAEIVQKIVFLWENFGPYHIDRLKSVAERYLGQAEIVGIELSSKSAAYAWESQDANQFQRLTLVRDGKHFFNRSKFWQFFALIRAVFKIGRADFFFCHYEQITIFLVAGILRLLGRRVFIINDMKYADFKRNIPREIIKSVFHFPYSGAVAAGRRSADYFRFLGINERKIHLGYGAVSLKRIDSYLEEFQQPEYRDRPFIVVARFLPMKNIHSVLHAYRLYRDATSAPRKLHLCGAGPLEDELRALTKRLEIEDEIVFRGFLQAEDVTREIAASVCLILFSTQETFGNVIIEALALGVPVIATPICGATDEFLKSGVNGFLVEPDNIEGLANYMHLIETDEVVWRQRSIACRAIRPLIDIHNFSEAVSRCVTQYPAPLGKE